ncbi:TraB/GumN family protein [Ferrimonas balearica]|uniref:TraB/GumN family protein n=1 Tax=Ferrimonas balearica TaxID=44012 RepID=UPI001C59543B|nr:TraB/GumN family protein [Ferrimonas balearica]MBW3140494.1 TraB/GumN family protein [Ferrimonas balearica]MBW3165512.1 TraB/GumN family protein [Ferrimonas balearica]MBY5981274.1 TraB/GumN family protein [Ferrimonas balearica]MBY6107692.1 TraB/GumN family protein [Ferrimonas balearica]MBY6226665.1 TraB/GumN family protein [Ferrimonas balearica]
MRALLLLLLLPFTVWAAPDDRPPFYQVEANGRTAWLLGTIHVGSRDFYPLPAPVESAFEQAQVLALEADPNDPEVPALLARYGRSDTPLPEPLAKQVAQRCQQLGFACDLGVSPWLLSAQLAMLQMAQAGYQPDLGVDSMLLSRKGQKPLWQLESMGRQMAIFTELSQSAQWAMLESTLEDADPTELVQAWRGGNAAELDALMRDGLSDSDELWQRLMVDRNHDMASTIGDWLERQDRVFIAVGAGHLVGPDGIPTLLKQAGVTVRDCWQEACQP